MYTVESIIVVKNSSGTIVSSLSSSTPLSSTVTGIDLEFEVTHRPSDPPLIRPKQFPKF